MIMSELENLEMACEMTVWSDVSGTQVGRGTHLAAAKGTRDRGRAALDTGEERVEHALAGEKGEVGLELLARGSGRADGPELEHRVLGLLALELGLEHDVLKPLSAWIERRTNVRRQSRSPSPQRA